MTHVILLEPEIPPNTGNIMRTCAGTGTMLHLVQPLGFELDNRRLRRAGLDYREYADVQVHSNLDAALAATGTNRPPWAFSTRGTTLYSDAQFTGDDVLLFGPETRGLPRDLLADLPAEHVLRIPMCPERRSLNLANSVAIAVYEAWRQTCFQGGI